VADEDFERFDYILAMDRDNFTILQHSAPVQHRHKLRMFLEFAPQMNEEEVPDPHYGGANGFDRVYDLVEAAAAGLLEEIRNRHL
ncbi:MAG: low molecular weight phosphotyrosine protein phosphatase, partial [Gammaproteobacteria bacterium]|nr:low molecular weight phosphotyrosine protein phosphatase [Gammaproteobacteria bacterium]